jgi:D-alanyl-lipoteichoic acid acyltransferase DltB (MBOAT superfamily)
VRPPLSTKAERVPTLHRYLRFRLGPAGGGKAWFNFFIKPFGASSFAEFWREWNPVYGYFLYYYAYQPLSRLMPRPLAVFATFIACGFFLHDVPAWAVTRRVLPPGATIAFALFAAGALLGERFRMNLSSWPAVARAAVNFAYLTGCIAAMLAIVLR